MNARSAQHTALLFGTGAVLLWSTVATAFKLTLNYLTPAQLVLVASTVSWLFFSLLITWHKRWHTLFTLPRATLVRALLLGLINPTVYYLVLFAAYQLLPAQAAMAINYTWALTLGLLAIPILGQKLLWRSLVAALISYLGVFSIATQGQWLSLEFAHPGGVLLALGSTLLWALYWLFNSKQTIDPQLNLFLNFSAALPALLAWCWFTGELQAIPWQGLLGATYIGFFEMGVSFVLWLHAMRYASNTLAVSSLIFLAPPISLVFIWLFLNEPILSSTLIGLALILMGLAMQHLADTHRAKTENK